MRLHQPTSMAGSASSGTVVQAAMMLLSRAKAAGGGWLTGSTRILASAACSTELCLFVPPVSSSNRCRCANHELVGVAWCAAQDELVSRRALLGEPAGLHVRAEVLYAHTVASAQAAQQQRALVERVVTP